MATQSIAITQRPVITQRPSTPTTPGIGAILQVVIRHLLTTALAGPIEAHGTMHLVEMSRYADTRQQGGR